jgi:hypothetical protein
MREIPANEASPRARNRETDLSEVADARELPGIDWSRFRSGRHRPIADLARSPQDSGVSVSASGPLHRAASCHAAPRNRPTNSSRSLILDTPWLRAAIRTSGPEPPPAMRTPRLPRDTPARAGGLAAGVRRLRVRWTEGFPAEPSRSVGICVAPILAPEGAGVIGIRPRLRCGSLTDSSGLETVAITLERTTPRRANPPWSWRNFLRG